MKRWLVERGGAVAMAATALYLVLAPAWIVDGDNAEFSTLAVTGGSAHPSGYPLYVLWLRATSWLPGSSAAHTAALATALLAGLQVLALHAAARAWGARPLAATAATAVYAVAPVCLRMNTQAEVFALSGLVVATVLWLAARNGPVVGIARCALLGLVAGLGLANHLTCALVAPVGILGVVRGARESSRAVLAIAAALAALVVGLTPYVYLVVASSPASWGRIDTAGDVLSIILRDDYGGPGSFAAHSRGVDVVANLAALADTLGRSWLWLPALAGVAWLAMRSFRRGEPEAETRVAWSLLAISWLVAGPLLVAKFNIPPRGLGLYVVQRFHILPTTLLVVPVAIAIDDLARRVHISVRTTVASGLLVAIVATSAALALPRLFAQHSPAMQAGVHNALTTFPDRAIVMVGSEEQCLGMHYLQLTQAVRLDVDVVCWPMISRAWYREPLEARGVPLGNQPGSPASAETGAALLATGRPLFVDEAQPTLLRDFPDYPVGIFFRVLPEDQPVPTLQAIVAENRAVYERFDLRDHPAAGDDYAAIAFLRYAFIWRKLAAAADAAGDRDASAFAHTMADELAPSSR